MQPVSHLKDVPVKGEGIPPSSSERSRQHPLGSNPCTCRRSGALSVEPSMATSVVVVHVVDISAVHLYFGIPNG